MQWYLHAGIDGKELFLHAHFDIDQRHLRAKRGMRPEELVLRRRFAHRHRNNALCRRAGHAGKVAAQAAIFQFILIECRLIFGGQQRVDQFKFWFFVRFLGHFNLQVCASKSGNKASLLSDRRVAHEDVGDGGMARLRPPLRLQFRRPPRCYRCRVGPRRWLRRVGCCDVAGRVEVDSRGRPGAHVSTRSASESWTVSYSSFWKAVCRSREGLGGFSPSPPTQVLACPDTTRSRWPHRGGFR